MKRPTLYRNKIAHNTVRFISADSEWVAVQCGNAEPFCVRREAFEKDYVEVKK